MNTEVAVVTGTRAEYGILRPVMKKIEAAPGLSLSTVVTGMHLSTKHGNTIADIRDDGFTIDRSVEMLLDSDTGVGMAKSLGIGLSGISEALGSIDPDIVVVLGDRGEAFAAGVAAVHLDIPVAHIHGGDKMNGSLIDDSIRHALTKFAHIHFPGSALSAERIKKLGEEEWRIRPVGALALDEILDGSFTSAEEVRERYDIDENRDLLLVVQHPLTVTPGDAGGQMRATMEGIEDVDASKIVIYPNSDTGSDAIIDVLESYENEPDVRTYRNLPREDYLGILAAADAIVGNSSSGIVEAPSLGTPAVDVGPRQDGRERADHSIAVPHEATAIREAVRSCLTDPETKRRAKECDNPYDFGGAAENIVTFLQETTFDERVLRKQLTYE